MPSISPLIKPKFATLAKKRYPQIPAMARNGSLEEEFSLNAEFLRLRLEFVELRRLLLVYKSPALADEPDYLPTFKVTTDRRIADVGFAH